MRLKMLDKDRRSDGRGLPRCGPHRGEYENAVQLTVQLRILAQDFTATWRVRPTENEPISSIVFAIKPLFLLVGGDGLEPPTLSV